MNTLGIVDNAQLKEWSPATCSQDPSLSFISWIICLTRQQFLACFLLLFICFSVCAEDKKNTSFQINGIKDTVLANVEKRLNELQQLKPLNELPPEQLHIQIIKALQPYGYFKANINTQFINNQKIRIDIDPGPQTHISTLNIQLIGEGADNPELKKIIQTIPLRIGDPLLTEEYSQAKQNISNTAENLGYLRGSFSKAEALIDEGTNNAQISLVYDTGHLFYFGQVQFDPTNINPELLHRFVPFQYKEPYSTDTILKFNNSLSNSGYFSSVVVKPEITNSETVPIAVRLEPVPKYSYSLGAGYGTDTGVRGRAGLYVIPVNQLGHKFNALAQGSFIQNAIQAQYLIPGTNPVTDEYSITGNFSNLNYSTGYSNAYLLSLAQQHHLDFFKRSLSINALYESFNYSQQPHTDQFMLYPKATFTFRNAQSQLFSPSGYNLTVNALGASQLTLSKTSFAQMSFDVKAAYKIEPWGLRLYGHTMQGITTIHDINQLPLSLALLLGGTENLKAFSFNSIGPGKKMIYGGFEIQKETVKNWYLVGFYDVGDVYSPSIKNTQYDVGLALMWVSPIGPIKIGLAQSVDSDLRRVGTNPRLVVNMGPDL